MTSRRPRTGAPRVDLARDSIAELLHKAEHHENRYFPLATTTARAVLALALSTFNDAGTSGADLDEELCQIDDLLEGAGFELGRGGTVAAIKVLIGQARRRALMTCKRCLRTTKRPKPKKPAKQRSRR